MGYIFTPLFLVSLCNIVYAHPTAIIAPSSITVCAGQSIIFNDASTRANINAWS